ncbi:MAG: 23S rRNA (adenine(2503)-C(2))-methyltransferase RlmN [Methylacidiphilales bacterium]|nr:23S rRNA (adenine(2503)-C(2))-methyltransferase RlmN [Candidatus Methylacidiphilales bacterium]
MNSTQVPNIIGLTKSDLECKLFELNLPNYRITQILSWLYQLRVGSFIDMVNLPLSLRKYLEQNFKIKWIEPVNEFLSVDGTVKWIFNLDCHNVIETVYIPEISRSTLCVSSQIGCVLNCSFCATGRMGFNRNLQTDEILSQVHYAINRIYKIHKRKITNIVFMGMGEPLSNTNSVFSTIELLLHPNAYGISKRKITVSTAGIVPKIELFAESKLGVSLALSLHAPNDTLRNSLVPLNKKYPIKQTLESCFLYLAKTNSETLTIEYTMIDQVNDSEDLACQLAKLLKNKPVKINLIPFNTFDGSGYNTSNEETTLRFAKILKDHGLFTTIRKNRGRDISAACGQLANKIVDLSNRQIKFIKPTNGLMAL